MRSGSACSLDLCDIQGNILSGYSHRHIAHSFGAISPVNVRRWRAALGVLDVTSEDGASRTDVARNVGISHAGMLRLVPGVAERLEVFEAYATGMRRRAALLGDDEHVPWSEWAPRHVWIAVHARDSSLLHEEVSRLHAVFEGLLAPTVLFGEAVIDRNGHRLEPFGFRDDISQPAIQGAPNESSLVRGGGKLDAARENWLPIAAGEFLLGHPNEQGRDVLAKLPAIAPMLLNGTFAVFRELVQDVALFHGTSRAAAAAWRMSEEELKARLVGRYADGESLARRGAYSDFDYDDDPDGIRCPLGAHVRRANPRLTGEHRVIRRGMPYRRKASEGAEPGADVQGLYFVALNASIEKQFELIQSIWLNSTAGPLPGSRDPVVGEGPERARMLIEGDAEAGRDPIVLTLPRFVTCRGGEYYFVPGLRGLQRIVGLAGAEDR